MDLASAGRLLASCAVIAFVLAGVQLGVRGVVMARARATPHGGRLVDILETTLLPNASSLHVVRVGDRYVVVGRSAGMVALVCDVPEASVVAWRGGPPSPAARSA